MVGGNDHPYYPPNAPILGWTPNSTPLSVTLFMFAAAVGSVIVGTYLVAASRRLGTLDRFAACWFALCAFLHLTFESYYLLYRNDLPRMNTFYAQLWKEYTLSDSRYLTSDVFTVCVETITVFALGPLSLLAAISILNGSNARHFLQAMVCTSHLFSVSLYYSTSWTELQLLGVSYSRPEFLYFWIYYVGFNLPWAVVPPVLLYDSFSQTTRAFASLQAQESRRKAA
jgi:cholestenol delta-isomerase